MLIFASNEMVFEDRAMSFRMYDDSTRESSSKMPEIVWKIETK